MRGGCADATIRQRAGNSARFQNVPWLPNSCIPLSPHRDMCFSGGEGCHCLRSSKGSLSLERSERTTDLERREMDIFKEKVSRLSDRKQALGCHFYLIRNDPDMAT